MPKGNFEGHVLNKPELVAAVMEEVTLEGITKKETEATLNAFFKVVQDQLALGNKIQIIGHGTYEVAERAERIGRNPKTKEEILIPAKKAPVFKAGKVLKDAVK